MFRISKSIKIEGRLMVVYDMDEDGKREGLQMSTSFPFGVVKVF